VTIVFWSFRIMVAIGFLMLGLGAWSLLARWRGKLHDWSLLHRAAVLMGPSASLRSSPDG
jgi:cytochrome d ubiquinol oxidase subunit I